MKKLTIVAPAYNEAEGIREFYSALTSVLGTLSGYQSEILFVVDGGTDATFEILSDIASVDSSVHALKFSRNFGHQMALLAGIDHAHGDAIITMDSDLQHPPTLIPKLLEAYEKGNDIVYTVREENGSVNFVRRLAGDLFYRFVNLISDVPIKKNVSDFRLISERVADILRRRIRERNLFLRGVVSWIGFTQTAISFTANPRFAGKSKYSLSHLVQFAIFGIISFSKKPLRAATFVGMLFALGGFSFTFYTTFHYFFGTPLPSGWATLVVLLSVFGGVQLVFLGVIGEYIGAIFDEVKGRPHYIVAESIGVSLRDE